MEETLNKLKVTYVGNIHDVAYFNLEYADGFGPNTTVKVADTCTCCFLTSKVVENYADYNNSTLRTLMIPNQSESNPPTDYTIKLYEGETLVEDLIVKSDSTDVPALIKEDAHVKSIGDRIIEIVFDEPVRHLESNFDFAIDRFNKLSPLALTNNKNIIYYDNTNKYYYFNTANGSFKVSSEGAELSDSCTPDLSNSRLQFINLTILNTSSIKLPLTPNSPTSKLEDGITTGQDAYVGYYSEYSEDLHKTSAVLINYYFRYFGTDDEGTLYEPKDKPIDWLGYFSGHDITTKVSSDNRKLEIQFDAYSLPTASIAQGDVPHQLIINYAKTFPNYPGDRRISDANNNPFPIIRESVEFIKDSLKAKVTNIVALSKDEVLVYFDKAVLCQNPAISTEHTHYNLITINGATPKSVSRYSNTYNILKCELNSIDALPVGEVDVTVGSVIDACGYLTLPFAKSVEVVAVRPKVISMTQGQTPNEGSETILDIRFDDDMAIIPPDASPYFTIYKIENEIKELITPISITKLSQTPTDTLKVSIVPALEPGGLYEVHIFDMKNIYDTVMEDYKGLLHIKDMSAPEIKAIYLTDHISAEGFSIPEEQYKIAILFNETMESQGDHSLLNCRNYMFYYPKDITDLNNFVQCNESAIKFALTHDNTLDVDSLKGNTIARIILNQENYPSDDNKSTIPFNPANLIVKAGYCDLTDVKYLTNSAGNVLDFLCPTTEVSSNKVNLTTAKFNVIDSKNVVITYTVKNNEIISANKHAFTLNNNVAAESIIIGSVSRNPATEIVTGTLTITFPENSFDDPGQTISIENTCEDIFGNTIIGVVDLALTYDPVPRLVNAYVSNIHSDSVIFGLEFNEDVKFDGSMKLAGRDYSASVNGGHYRAATAIGSLIGNSNFDTLYVQNPYGPRKTLFLQYDNINDEIFDLLDTFKLSVTVPREQFKTVDKTSTPLDRKPVETFSDKVVVATPSFTPDKLQISKALYLDESLFFTVSPVSSGAKLDEITVPLDLNLVPTSSTTTETIFASNGLFKSFKINTSAALTNPIITPPTLKFTSNNGIYSFSLSFETGDLTNIVSVEFEFIDALPTTNGVPVIDFGLTLDASTRTEISATAQYHTNPTAYTRATLELSATPQLDEMTSVIGSTLTFVKSDDTNSDTDRFIIYTVKPTDSVKLCSQVKFNFETTYTYISTHFAPEISVDVSFNNGKYTFGELTNSDISITGITSVTITPIPNAFIINEIPVPLNELTTTQGSDLPTP
ncbi:MAG: hypothetical protein ACRCWM_03550 [Sarcina sp.]